MMKKILSLLLALALLLPAFALAEEAAEIEPLDLGFALLTPGIDDLAAQSDDLVLLVPAIDSNPDFTNSITVLPLDVTMDDLGATSEAFADMVIEQGVNEALDAELDVIDYELIRFVQDEATGAVVVYYSMVIDYTPSGADLVTELYQYVIVLPAEDDGTYLITLTAMTAEGIDGLLEVLRQAELK